MAAIFYLSWIIIKDLLLGVTKWSVLESSWSGEELVWRGVGLDIRVELDQGGLWLRERGGPLGSQSFLSVENSVEGKSKDRDHRCA